MKQGGVCAGLVVPDDVMLTRQLTARGENHFGHQDGEGRPPTAQPTVSMVDSSSSKRNRHGRHGAGPSIQPENSGNYNAATEKYPDLIQMGILDPTEVQPLRAAERGVYRRSDDHSLGLWWPSIRKRRRALALAAAWLTWEA